MKGPKVAKKNEVVPPDDDLIEIRCRCCGVFMGYRKNAGKINFWCSEDCCDTPMAKYEDAQPRDEVIVELWLGGLGIMEMSRILKPDDPWPYQYVQQTLARRGLQEFMVTVKDHVRTWTDPEGEVVPEHRVRLVRAADKVPA